MNIAAQTDIKYSPEAIERIRGSHLKFGEAATIHDEEFIEIYMIGSLTRCYEILHDLRQDGFDVGSFRIDLA
jgi:hypothetical protein